ncbi:MAG: hypothetical protein ABWK00_05320 [Desulfurococcaceae archaeon]
MPEGQSSRKLVYVSEELLGRASRVAARKGLSVSKLVEKALQTALRLEELGYDFERVPEILELMEMERKLGSLWMPAELADLQCISNEEAWRRSGIAHGIYMRERLKDPLRALAALLGLLRWDLSEVKIEEEGGAAKALLVSAVLDEGSLASLASFVEGALQALGYSCGERRIYRGLALLTCKKA